MVLYVDFVCGVCSTNQVHHEYDALRFDWGTWSSSINTTTLFTTSQHNCWSVLLDFVGQIIAYRVILKSQIVKVSNLRIAIAGGE